MIVLCSLLAAVITYCLPPCCRVSYVTILWKLLDMFCQKLSETDRALDVFCPSTASSVFHVFPHLSLLQTRREKCGRMLCWDFQDACWFQIPLDWTCQSIIGWFMSVLKIVLLPFQCENTASEATTFVTMMMSLGRRFSGFYSKISVV